jgi:serine-type D-Ala-D-Ala carboxypeptidase/endopeptidase
MEHIRADDRMKNARRVRVGGVCSLRSPGQRGAAVFSHRTRKNAFSAIIVLLCALLLSRVGVAERPPDVVGNWLGILSLSANIQGLRMVLHVTADSAGKFKVTLDSIDQGTAGMPGTGALDGNHFTYEIPSVHDHYSGTISSDGNTITGEYKQYLALPAITRAPLVFKRVTGSSVPTVVAAAAQPTPAPAMPPVTLDNLKAVLDRELAPVLGHGVLSNESGGGIVIGVLDHGRRRIFTYGTARPDSIFEIGSVTKTFTGLILAQMVAQKKVTLDEPVRELFPAGFVAKPDGPEITLLDLATHHSGLPWDAKDLKSSWYAEWGFGVPQLREFLAQHIAKPADPEYSYSNIGFALLGYSLSLRAGLPYEQLLRREITGPLHMNDTFIKLSPAQQKRLIRGYNTDFEPEPKLMDPGLFPGAGGIKSTAADILTYLDANMHPEKYAAGARANSPSATLPAAVDIDHKLRAETYAGAKIALAWIIKESGTYQHSGGSFGHTSYAQFNAGRDQALVVLYNRRNLDALPYADRVGANVDALLEGKPVISLDVVLEDEREALQPHVFSNRSILGSYDCSLAALPLMSSTKDAINVAATGDVHLVADGNGAITGGTMTYRLAPPKDLVCKLKLDSGRYSIKPDGTGTETETWRLDTDQSPRSCFEFSSPARPPVTVEGQLKLTDAAGTLFHSASIAPFAMLIRVCTPVSATHVARTSD